MLVNLMEALVAKIRTFRSDIFPIIVSFQSEANAALMKWARAAEPPEYGVSGSLPKTPAIPVLC